MSDVQEKRIAVFDFDATLAAHDSLWPFLKAAAGCPRYYAALLAGTFVYLVTPKNKDSRTAAKKTVLRRTLAGRSLESLKPAVERMKKWPRWMGAYEALLKHHAQGHHILIASGSLDVYMPFMLQILPHDGLLCTQMEVKDGVLTGEMGASGHCVRQRKAELVAAYMQEHGPFVESWGYGNAPHDLPMMALMTHQTVIG